MNSLDTHTIEGSERVTVVTPVDIVNDEIEVAWEGARTHVQVRPDFGWMMGRYVAADTFNENGHWFPLDDLRTQHLLIPRTPLNMLHRVHQVVGTYAASELVDPHEVAGDLHAAGQAGVQIRKPIVETLAALWRFRFPEEYHAIIEAQKQGLAWQSMEAFPESLTCKAPGCDLNFPFAGPQSDTYCEHLNEPRSKKILHKPHFLGGGIIIPPARPGWKRADIAEVAQIIEEHEAEGKRILASVAALAPTCSADDWHYMMGCLLKAGGYTAEIPAVPVAPGFEAKVTAPVDQPATAAAAAPPRGVIVAVVPPADVAARIAGLGTETVDQIHITLADLGKVEDDGPLPDGTTLGQLTAIIGLFCLASQPVGDAKVSGIGRFDLGDGSEAVYASVDSPRLSDMRSQMVAALESAGITVDHTHGFTPHITVDYVELGAGAGTPLPDEAIAWSIEHLEVWWAGQHVAYPFGPGALDET